jgi:hypothetical protein
LDLDVDDVRPSPTVELQPITQVLGDCDAVTIEVEFVPVQLGDTGIAFDEEDIDEVFSHAVHFLSLRLVTEVTAASP